MQRPLPLEPAVLRCARTARGGPELGASEMGEAASLGRSRGGGGNLGGKRERGREKEGRELG